MKKISEVEYKQASTRIEELLKVANNDTAQDDPYLKELIAQSDIVENYETENYSTGIPLLKDVIEL